MRIRRFRKRTAAVAVLLVVLLTALMGVTAIAIDGGMEQDNLERVQAAADAAALAAVIDLYQHYSSNGGADTGGTAASSATGTASTNGFDSTNSTVTVNLYPNNAQMSSLIGVGTQVPKGYAEVIITYNQPRYFGRIWGSATIPITAYAVARTQWKRTDFGIIALNPTVSGSVTTNGNGDVKVTGASIIVDSNNTYAVTVNGHSLVSDSGNGSVLITGSNPGYSGTVSGQILTGQVPTPDPFAYLPVPDPSTMTTQTTASVVNGTITLQPGYYPNGISTSTNAAVVMQPGIYYINGGINYSGNGSLTANGVMIYATGTVSVTGNATVTMSPMTSGPYYGMTFFQARNATGGITVAGNGSYNVSGSVYSAGGAVTVSGNGDVSLSGQIVANTLTFNGNGAMNVVWNGGPTARTREITLVE